jgi:hypothetical protein
VGAETAKLLGAPDPAMALAGMAQTGVLGTILPGADIRFVQLMIHGGQSAGIPADWIGRLVALGGRDVPVRLRLSRADQRRYGVIRSAAFDGASLLETAFDHGADVAIQAYLIQCAIAEAPLDPAYTAVLEAAAAQVFPVTAHDLMPEFTGARLGARLGLLKSAWIASGFTLEREQLLALPMP